MHALGIVSSYEICSDAIGDSISHEELLQRRAIRRKWHNETNNMLPSLLIIFN